MAKTNPHLKQAFLDVVNNQIEANDPPETKETLDRLIAQGLSKEDAKLCIARAVCVEIWDIGKNLVPFNRDRFIRNLKNLPQKPTE